MIRILAISFLLVLYTNISYSQDKDKTIPYDSVIINKNKVISNVYNINLYIKSKDKRFNFDSYAFQVINSERFDELPFKDLKQKTNIIIDELTLLEIKQIEPCRVHEMLSLTKDIFLIKKENKNIYYWRMVYVGTSKNGGYTDLH